ncbi:MAG: sulfatase [Anaerolineae bacterium]
MLSAELAPHIVLVVLDTHRRDRLGCYGCPRGTSPNLDAFAQQATIFDTAIASAQWTMPAHASMFSGEPPSVHMALQSSDVLNEHFATLAECFAGQGYRTVGFCNNPLVGVLDNGLRRGFDVFFNYCGAFPSARNGSWAGVIGRLGDLSDLCLSYLRRVSRPIERAFADSNSLFQGALDPFWVPKWTRIASFKGNTTRSIRDVVRFVETEMSSPEAQPTFLFVNLMETHLPYSPPSEFRSAFVPAYLQARARSFLQALNRRAGDWFTPPEHPFTELEMRALVEMYDAEVAYQDHLLAGLLRALSQPQLRDHTLVVFAADHGEMLGEHQLTGHAYGVHRGLVHVPLLMRLPGQLSGRRVAAPVSTTWLFHTLLDAAGLTFHNTADGQRVELGDSSLLAAAAGGQEPEDIVVCEAYAPEFALEVMERRKPALIDQLNCRATYRVSYEGGHRLVSVEGVDDQLVALGADGRERQVEDVGKERHRRRLLAHTKTFLERARARRPHLSNHRPGHLGDAIVRQRLRDLGYIE